MVTLTSIIQYEQRCREQKKYPIDWTCERELVVH